jgi:hypothetical protein
MYVQSYSTNTLTVVRGVNGTTAAAHTTGAALAIYQYPSPIAEATLIQAARLWKRRDTPVSRPDPSGGQRGRGSAALDLDVMALLSAYTRIGTTV